MEIKDAFKQMENEHLAGSKVDFTFYRILCERILLNHKSSAILISIFIAVLMLGVTFVEELRISKRNHIITEQREMLTVPRADSLQFKCPHCGWNDKQPVQEISPTQ